MNTEDIRQHYQENQQEINKRLEAFKELRDAQDHRWFLELVFVILSSQTEAKKAWKAAKELDIHGLLLEGDKDTINTVLEDHDIQYERNKADYIVENREKLSQPTLADPQKKLKLKDKVDPDNLEKSREWLAENIKGISWKGASHFLRNIGYGNSFGIISKHILTALNQLGAIESTDQPSNRDEYVEIEEKMQELSRKVDVEVPALDLILWSMQTDEIFK
jgi:N-glycosylase/DNA lyase